MEKTTILIIDDSTINRNILHNVLKSKYEVVEAENGQVAFDILNSGAYSISALLLDLSMPVMDGYSFLKIFRANPGFSSIPVIVITGDDSTEAEVQALKLGANDFIPKPFSAVIVCQRVANHVEFSRLREQKEIYEIDPVTGIYSERAFFLESTLFLRDCKTSLQLFYIGINSFSFIRNQFGINTGNKILCCIAQILRTMIKEGVFGRLADDGFAVCLPRGSLKVEELYDAMDKGLSKLGLSYDIYIHFGIYFINDPTKNMRDMLYKAELAENSIRDSFVEKFAYYDQKIRDQLAKEQEIFGSMQTALDEEQFVVHFQPVYNLDSHVPVSAEALVRWNHPVKGWMYPSDFIPVFEKTGFISNMDCYVWEKACQVLSTPFFRDNNLSLSVNISRTDFYQIDVCGKLCALVEKYDLEPKSLKLEITEGAYSQQPLKLLAVMERLRGKGFLIMMDDFGSGYSSLNLLKDFPIDYLKIDMKFFENAQGNQKRSDSIVSSIIQMAQRIQITVVAEGVETEEQVKFLDSLGCKLIQGYYFSKPVALEEFTKKIGKKILVYQSGSERIQREMSYWETFWNLSGEGVSFFSDLFGAFGVFRLSPDGKNFDVKSCNPIAKKLFGEDGGRFLFEMNYEAMDRGCDKARSEHQLTTVSLLNNGVPVCVVLKFITDDDDNSFLFSFMAHRF
ncbi:MAG: EAL domain-containing protein [Sphaerochaetaceae bacterium]